MNLLIGWLKRTPLNEDFSKKYNLLNELTQKFINGINYLVDKEYNPRTIARYADEFSLDNRINDRQLKYVVYYIRSMDADPEFELTKEELVDFIKQNLL